MTHRRITNYAVPQQAPQKSLCASCRHVERESCEDEGAKYERVGVRTERGWMQITVKCSQYASIALEPVLQLADEQV